LTADYGVVDVRRHVGGGLFSIFCMNTGSMLVRVCVRWRYSVSAWNCVSIIIFFFVVYKIHRYIYIYITLFKDQVHKKKACLLMGLHSDKKKVKILIEDLLLSCFTYIHTKITQCFFCFKRFFWSCPTHTSHFSFLSIFPTTHCRRIKLAFISSSKTKIRSIKKRIPHRWTIGWRHLCIGDE
jgi:hypothetical protein